ncbi:MAG: DUF2797 domain-containing protein [Candidatus Helarchaeota archaeon]
MLNTFEEDLWVDSNIQRNLSIEFEPNLFEFIINYYLYKPLIDVYIPHLEVVSNYGDRQVVPFFGQFFVKLSKDRFCVNCLNKIDIEDNHCESCIHKLGLEFLSCVKLGPGLGKGICDLNDSDCSEFSRNYCLQDHILYLALFEDSKIKIGMSRRDRIFFRLIEQGASYAILFQREKGKRNFVDTHQLEQRIAREFGIIDKVVFEEKIEIFDNKKRALDVQISKLQAYRSIFQDFYKLEEILSIDLRKFFFPIPEFQKVEKEKLEFNGRVISFRGSVGFIKENGNVTAFDLNKLKGRKMENIRG